MKMIKFCELKGLGDYVLIIKDTGVTIKANSNWDGDINNIHKDSLPIVTVETNPDLKYPFEITGVKEKGYLRYSVLNREELLVYLISHELRHLWQGRNNSSLDDYGSQQDADVYAVKKVEAWRKMGGKPN
ncbi:MAG: hypothetical protein ABSE71_03180 [Candidatus Micrarchaeaceae archaeon]|jgi:hypothetical protein